MFDFTWGDGGVTIYWPTNNPQTTFPGQVPVYPVYQEPMRISNGVLILGAVLLYLLLKK